LYNTSESSYGEGFFMNTKGDAGEILGAGDFKFYTRESELNKIINLINDGKVGDQKSVVFLNFIMSILNP